MRRNLSEVQKDVADLREAAAEREAKDKAVSTRLTAVEERLATVHASSEATDASPKAKISERHTQDRTDRSGHHRATRCAGANPWPAVSVVQG